jgi:hypothetical protein
MQPYLFPYIGYFQLIHAVDKFVIYDDVNFIKGGWINRNNILINGEKKLLSIALKDSSPNKLINEIEIADNFIKLLKTIKQNYSKAPYYKGTIQLIEEIISYEAKSLGVFIANSIKKILSYLQIDTEIVMSSALKKNVTLKAQEKVIHICKLLNAHEYINAIGGLELYNKKDFQQENIKLNFLKTKFLEYEQFDNYFIPGLSMIDVLMFNSVEEIRKMLDNYELI